MTDHLGDFRSALALAETPRPPAPEFEARLLHELLHLDEATVTELVPAVRRSRERPPRSLLVATAAAAVAAVVIGLIAWQRGDTPLATTPASQPPSTLPTPDIAAGRRACATFRSTAFAPLSRNDVIRLGNAEVLPSATDITNAVTRLGAAHEDLSASLKAAGFHRDTVRRPLDRIGSRLRQAANYVDRGLLDDARDGLRAIDDQLVNLNVALGSLGLDGCT